MITVDTSPWARHPGGYGQTEVVGMLTFAALGAGALGGHGRTSPLLQVRIVDPDDREVAPGETGEITCRGPLVMNGYWNRPDETARRFRNGWHHTNDLGRREADGSLTFVGPKTRLIKSAAENIYPAEVEGAIRSHPDVADCAVIGVPDRKWTQSVTAIVVAREGATIAADDVIGYCRDRIASYKKPRHVEFVDAIPRQGFAVDYDALDARFGGGGYPGRRLMTSRAFESPTSFDPPLALGTDVYRRRILVRTVAPGEVVADLEDDFHHFRITLRHDGHVVESVDAESIRWPWSTCPGAAVPLRALAGAPLSTRWTHAARFAKPALNCTHQFDAAAHAITQAARQRDGHGDGRQYDVEVAALLARGRRTRAEPALGRRPARAAVAHAAGPGTDRPAARARGRAVAGRFPALGRRAPRTRPRRAGLRAAAGQRHRDGPRHGPRRHPRRVAASRVRCAACATACSPRSRPSRSATSAASATSPPTPERLPHAD